MLQILLALVDNTKKKFHKTHFTDVQKKKINKFPVEYK